MQDTPQGHDHRHNKKLRIVLWILICLAASEFIVRGPVRFLLIPNNWNDLSQNYTASKLWLNGLSPSDPRNFVVLWKQETRARLELTDIRTHLAPPLGGLVVMAPIAVFPFRIAKILWLIVLLISFAASVWGLLLVGGFRRDELRTLAFVAACFALAPFQTGIASGNMSILVIALCAIAIWAAGQSRDITAGLLFGVACSLKPQLGAFLVLYYLVRGRWRLFGTAVATTTGLTVGAALYLQFRGVHWFQDYVHNAQGFVTANHIDDFSTANPSRFTLINLQVPFFSITGQSSSANLLAFAVTGLLLCAWLYSVARGLEHEFELLALAAISVLALLPVYHRFYDAALLIVPLCWCMTVIVGQLKPIVQIVLLLMAVFLVPGAAFLQELAVGGHIPEAVTTSWFWNCVLMPHESWALLALSVFLLYAIRASSSASQSETTSPRAI